MFKKISKRGKPHTTITTRRFYYLHINMFSSSQVFTRENNNNNNAQHVPRARSSTSQSASIAIGSCGCLTRCIGYFSLAKK